MFETELKRLLAALKPRGSRLFSEIMVKHNINLVGINDEQRIMILDKLHRAACEERKGGALQKQVSR